MSVSGATCSFTGSLTSSAPAAIVAVRSPPNVSTRSVSGSTAAWLVRTPICAAPMASGRVPYAFDSRTRSVSPPMLMRAVMRNVWLLSAAPSAGAGAVAQVPTQCMPFAMV